MRRGRFPIALGALTEPRFRLFYIGHVTSMFGTGMTLVALTFAVLSTGAGASAVGVVLAAQTVPMAAIVLIGGAVADKLSRRVVMVAADILRCGAQGLMAALLFSGTPSLWHFVVLAGAVGVGDAFFVPATTGLVVETVSKDRLTQANALTGIAVSLGNTVGPAVAGVLVAVAGPGWALAVDAATYAVSAACLVKLRTPGRVEELAPLLRHLKEGWREFISRSWLWVVVLQFFFFHVLVFAPFLVLGPVVAKDSLGGAAVWGTIQSAFGVGALAGGVVMLRVRPSRPLLVAVAGNLGWVAVISLLAITSPIYVIATGAFVAGVGVATFNTLWETVMQRHIPLARLSSVSSYDWLASAVSLPIGMTAVGPVAETLGVSATLACAAAFQVASSAAVLAVPSVWNLRTRREL